MESYTSPHDPPPLVLAPKSSSTRYIHRFLDCLFICAGVTYWTFAIPLLVPMYAWQLVVAQAGSHNVSVARRGGSGTAAKAAWGRAIIALCGFRSDDYALALLPHIPGVLGGGSLVMRGWTALFMAHWRTTHAILTDELGRLTRLPFLRVSLMRMYARSTFLDSMVRGFQARHPEGQLVIVGAGYDTRCWRFGGGFDLDAPGTQLLKRKAVQAAGLSVDNVHFVPVDFSSNDWMELLCKAGFRRNVPACFVWEGVTFYLKVADVEKMLRDVAGCAPGSVIGFDYVSHQLLLQMQRVSRWVGEGFQFALSEDEVAPLAKRCGLELVEHVGCPALQARYAPPGADGRTSELNCRLVCSIGNLFDVYDWLSGRVREL